WVRAPRMRMRSSAIGWVRGGGKGRAIDQPTQTHGWGQSTRFPDGWGPKRRGARRTGPLVCHLRPGSATRGVVHRDCCRALGGTGVADLVGRAAGAGRFSAEGVGVLPVVRGSRHDLTVEQHVHLVTLATGPLERNADALAPQCED